MTRIFVKKLLVLVCAHYVHEVNGVDMNNGPYVLFQEPLNNFQIKLVLLVYNTAGRSKLILI